jgi:ATP-dependent DNA helicase RecG
VLLFKDKLNEDVNVGVNVGVSVVINVGVNDLLRIITDNPGVNAKQFHVYFDVTDRTVERWIKQLREENKIEFKGAPKTGGYFFKENKLL